MGKVIEQYVLISTAFPFDSDFADFVNNYPPENFPFLSWISFWFFILLETYPFVPRLYFSKAVFKSGFVLT